MHRNIPTWRITLKSPFHKYTGDAHVPLSQNANESLKKEKKNPDHHVSLMAFKFDHDTPHS